VRLLDNCLIHRDDGNTAIQHGADIGQEEVYEFQEEGAEKFFEQAVVIHNAIVPDQEPKAGQKNRSDQIRLNRIRRILISRSAKSPGLPHL